MAHFITNTSPANRITLMTTAICMVIFYCRFHLLFPMFQKYHDFFTNSFDKSHLSYVKWFFTVFHTYCFLWFLHEHSYDKPYHADHCHHLCDDYHTDHRHHLYGDYHADHRHHLYGDSLLYVTPIFFYISDIPRLLHKHSYDKLYHLDRCNHLYDDSLLYIMPICSSFQP